MVQFQDTLIFQDTFMLNQDRGSALRMAFDDPIDDNEYLIPYCPHNKAVWKRYKTDEIQTWITTKNPMGNKTDSEAYAFVLFWYGWYYHYGMLPPCLHCRETSAVLFTCDHFRGKRVPDPDVFSIISRILPFNEFVPFCRHNRNWFDGLQYQFSDRNVTNWIHYYAPHPKTFYRYNRGDFFQYRSSDLQMDGWRSGCAQHPETAEEYALKLFCHWIRFACGKHPPCTGRCSESPEPNSVDNDFLQQRKPPFFLTYLLESHCKCHLGDLLLTS